MSVPAGTNNPILEGSPTRSDEPSGDCVAYTNGTALALPMISRAVYIGQAGTLVVDMAGSLATNPNTGTAAANGAAPAINVTFSGCVAGSILPLRITKIYSTSTSAGVVLY